MAKADKVQKSVLKPLLAYARPYRGLFGISMLLALITVATTLYAPILIGQCVDLIIGKGNVDIKALTPVLVKLCVTVSITAVSQWLMSLCTNKITFNVVRDIRRKAFSKLSRLPLSYIDAHPHGDIISRIITDIDQISDGLLMGFAQLFTGICTIIGTIIFMLSINVKISLVVILLTPLSLFVARFIAKNTFDLFHKQSVARGEMTALVEEITGNLKTVQAFSYEDEAEEQFDVYNKKLQAVSVKAIFFSSLTNPCTRFVNGLVYTSVGILGALTVFSGGSFTVGALSAFLSYANQYTKPFNEISGVITELQSALASAGRVFELIDEREEIPDDPDAEVLTKVDGSVDAEHVYFSYDPEVKLIEDFNLHVRAGERTAIVGPTGCGKTTMINLLMRFYDADSGSINISGKPIKNCTRDSMRSMYGMVLQETWLKTASIRDNIRYGKPDATEEEVIAAAKSAHCHGFIKRLPKGYDTVVSDAFSTLSQGQKQLLCIARVMLSLPPMLILDEATSSIDTRTEIMIQRAFAEMMKGRTSFIIAHRLSTIKEAENIIVMRSGHIVEQGTHESLIAKGGFYSELYNSQFAAE
ncbi:ABC transporter ATP-binding protein [Ruminococcus sp.]|uniref:ABC transporter related protein n=1 Tax=Ruminococcus albus (strain ATCC 27210 / DSM 20455 / JCM 14654 / NCDO 2250 / 7) TaxID=697329 RepID=E6UCU4_RUMA7|nr:MULTISPECIES: ABC transporter ATP-binding protein [Ruminococcus]ADU22773.1 ABC transporter related protein [Ruminococcus albus 7 = DSM 20455]MCR5022515.1 ABC transporter ATP-binding protein/permease [Ruminococcus sp.]